MKVFITGTCGFVGSTLAQELLGQLADVEIWGLDNFLREGSRSNLAPLLARGVRVLEGDIRNSAIQKMRPQKHFWFLLGVCFH